MEIGLDFDDKESHSNMEGYETALRILKERFGAERVFVRKSSSGLGVHIRVVGIDLTPEEELELRRELGDCEGRCIADASRVRAGTRSSWLFKYKSKVKLDKDRESVESVEVKESGEWHGT